MSNAIGVCSLCGGVVYSGSDSIPKCSKCGAIEKSKLPVLEMISVDDNNNNNNNNTTKKVDDVLKEINRLNEEYTRKQKEPGFHDLTWICPPYICNFDGLLKTGNVNYYNASTTSNSGITL